VVTVLLSLARTAQIGSPPPALVNGAAVEASAAVAKLEPGISLDKQRHSGSASVEDAALQNRPESPGKDQVGEQKDGSEGQSATPSQQQTPPPSSSSSSSSSAEPAAAPAASADSSQPVTVCTPTEDFVKKYAYQKSSTKYIMYSRQPLTVSSDSAGELMRADAVAEVAQGPDGKLLQVLAVGDTVRVGSDSTVVRIVQLAKRNPNHKRNQKMTAWLLADGSTEANRENISALKLVKRTGFDKGDLDKFKAAMQAWEAKQSRPQVSASGSSSSSSASGHSFSGFTKPRRTPRQSATKSAPSSAVAMEDEDSDIELCSPPARTAGKHKRPKVKAAAARSQSDSKAQLKAHQQQLKQAAEFQLEMERQLASQRVALQKDFEVKLQQMNKAARTEAHPDAPSSSSSARFSDLPAPTKRKIPAAKL
jgi:hypothetical protein